MRITVNVKTSSREEKVEQVSQASLGFNNDREDKVLYKVFVKEEPIDGKANNAVIRVLADYFNVPKSLIHLISGHTYKQKIFEVPDSK